MRKNLCFMALFLLTAGGLLMLWGNFSGAQKELTLSWGGQQITVGPGGITGAPSSAEPQPAPVPTDPPTPAPTPEAPQFTALWADLGLAGLRLTAGEEFRVSDGVDYTVENGTLVIRGELRLETVEITVPSDLTLAGVEVYVQGGDVELFGIRTAALKVEAELGDVYVSGTLTGDTVLRAEMGGITVESALSGYEYTGMARSRLGRVTVDGDDVGGGARLTGNGPHTMDLFAEVGDITLRFAGKRL